MLRIFVVYNKLRHTFDTDGDDTIASLRERVCDTCQIDTRGGKNGEQKFVVLQYQGADLQDTWKLGDIGVVAGSTLRCFLREEITPKLFVYCVYNDEKVEILEEVRFETDYVAALRSIISRRIGLPVTVYRILDPKGKEMYDGNLLQMYDIAIGCTVRLETWDGWNDFLRAASIGHTSHVSHNLSQDESIAKFQMRVALFIAAHYGHMDLASAILKWGYRSDEAIGEHPTKEWCASTHVESKKTAVHEASENGQLSILRIFVYNNICCVTCKDGNGLTALNVALRKQKREVALYLLTKQWSNVQYSALILPLTIFSKVRKWCDRAKDKVLLVHGPDKSSTKYKRTTRQPGGLCGEGVYVDGLVTSSMNTNPKRGSEISRTKKKKQKEQRRLTTAMTSFTGVTGSSSPDPRLPKISGVRTPTLVATYRERLRSKNEDDDENDGEISNEEGKFAELRGKIRPRSRSFNHEKTLALPKIGQKSRPRSSSQQENGLLVDVRAVSAAASSVDIGAERSKIAYIQTTGTGSRRSRRPKQQPILESVTAKSTVFEQNPAKAKKESRFDRMDKFRRQRKKASKMDSSIPLPPVSKNTINRPFFFSQSDDENIPRLTVDLYEEVNGKTTWERALEALTIASMFEEKPWLQRVRMAMVLSRNHVRRIKSLQRSPSSNDQIKSAMSGGSSSKKVTVADDLVVDHESVNSRGGGRVQGEEERIIKSAVNHSQETSHTAEVS
ncbi:protein ANKUB1 [Strongylocentrotus purpuratus]|uniref:Ubiquitin-like domain-containing protein n=1 Tax=Strongylocentrotus purpuratus TaxID=7668 RepID=A0A7M7THC8_STRPU|nr:protein ANKUB1 [Strongylocentrotus purpuratus]